MPKFAVVRCRPERPETVGQQSRHARGDDAPYRRREDAPEERCLAMHRVPGKKPRLVLLKRHERHPALDYKQLFENHKRRTGAQEWGKAPPMRHLLVGVSPELLGDAARNPKSPAVRKLITAACAWADKTLGGGRPCVFGARYDLDERGSAVVDVLVAPVRMKRTGIRKDGSQPDPKPKLLPAKAMRELAQAHGVAKSHSALQTSWWEYAREHLYPDIQRGIPKQVTGREHLSPEAYGEAADEARTHAEHNRQQMQAIADARQRWRREHAAEVRKFRERAKAVKAEAQANAELREALAKERKTLREAGHMLDACIEADLEPEATRDALFAIRQGIPLPPAAEVLMQHHKERRAIQRRKLRVVEGGDRGRGGRGG